MANETYSFPQIDLELEEQEEIGLSVTHFSRPGGVVVKTTAEYSETPDHVSERNILYIYSDYQTDSEGVNHPGIKVGDGKAYIVDLPFVAALPDAQIISKIEEKLNSKVSATIMEEDPENLVLYT